MCALESLFTQRVNNKFHGIPSQEKKYLIINNQNRKIESWRERERVSVCMSD